MDENKKTLGLQDPNVVVGNTDETIKTKKKKVLFHSEYDEPGMYEEFRPLWGPGSSYKPWVYGK